ncbi:MAG: DEAD/DEAH box helicase, partial [Anaerolineales bacterium]
MSDLGNLLSKWRSDPFLGQNIVAWENLPARSPQFVPFPNQLNSGLEKSLLKSGITELYVHQREAWDNIRSGNNCALFTGTASGKTLAYNLPILNYLLENNKSRALYLFPTKALSQDQLQSINKLLSETNNKLNTIIPSTYDGDTSPHIRKSIRQKSRLIITNPDMLHTGILPHHTLWEEFFTNLKFIVVDEIHVYRGVFGSHVANVFRRLKRIAKFYTADPNFILTSATIGNPSELAERLIEAPIKFIKQDTSLRGPKHFLIYNPPLVNQELGIRDSMTKECIRLTDDLYQYDIQTIVFSRTRRTTEIILRYLQSGINNRRENLRENSLAPKQIEDIRTRHRGDIRAYRGGYLPKTRRQIEQGIRSGDICIVIATTALELGIDIGGMDAVVLAGYPGNIASTWQQAGRAGRGEEDSLVVMVMSSSPLDQFLARHPHYFFERNPEEGLINPDNLIILLDHLKCAAFELPFTKTESFGNLDPNQFSEILDFLQNQGILYKSKGQYFWMSDKYPAQDISLRSATAERILLQISTDDGANTIGELDLSSAFWMVHPEAIYLHDGGTYFVEDLNLENNIANISPIEVDYYTRPRRETVMECIEKIDEAYVTGAIKAYGDVKVSSTVVGYHKIKWYSNEILGHGKVTLPPNELQTRGYWFVLDDNVVEDLITRGIWNNYKINYGPNWIIQRQRAQERDNHLCQICGIGEKEQPHHVHHKIPFRMYASYHEANRLDNLITLCVRCHQKAENNVKIRSGLAGLAFCVEQLAPLFLMCDIRDIGVHADSQSPLTQGKPTVGVFDLIPGGIGFSDRLFELHNELIVHAHDLVLNCNCIDGCPSCVGPGGE